MLLFRTKLLSELAMRQAMMGQQRGLSLAQPLCKKWKWLSRKDAAFQHEMTIGARHGHNDDPEYWPPNRVYTHSPEKGDKPIAEFSYRDADVPRSYLDRLAHKILATMFLSWFFYHMYWNSGMIFGHHYVPKPREFTDEELGIPPDDAPDPEYWGHHGKPWGTFR